ncbi:MAG: TetR/AcrR family transcriptional regulator [Acidimicrobiales bacterium]
MVQLGAEVGKSLALATKGERSRRAVLREATAQFAAAGRRGTSVPAIAREVGLTSSAVYAYFPTKQALFEEAIDADAGGLIADALPELLEGQFDRDFARVFQRLLAALPAHPLARRVLAGEEDSGVERLARLPAELRLHAGLSRALRQGQEEGTVRSDLDAVTMATGLEAIVIALLVAVLQSGGEVEAEVAAGVLAVLDAAVRPSS